MSQMTADESRRFAETVVLPPLLELAGLRGRLVMIEQRFGDRGVDRIVRALDVVGGVDFWLEMPGTGVPIAIASRVQWHRPGLPGGGLSLTVRTDIGGPPTEADKRVAAIRNGGLLPEWTAQGYTTQTGSLHHAGIIRTRDLFAAFLEAFADPRYKDWVNREDGHRFWAGFWKTLRKFGHAESLRVIEPPRGPERALPTGVGQPARVCWYPHHRHADWRRSPGHMWVCGICHPPAVPGIVGERRDRTDLREVREPDA
jgi:hypothetical protein